MKKSVSVQIDAEKLSAIQFYAAKRDSSLEAKLEDFVQKLYEKHVPRETREYIERTTGKPEGKPRPRPSRASSAPADDSTTKEGKV